MNLYTHPALVTLWIVVMVSQGYVLGLLLGRKACRDYPAFTAFMAFCVVRSTVLFYLAHNAMWLYRPVKWAAYIPQLVILVALVLEVFHILFHPYKTLPKGTVGHFVQAVVAVAVAAVALVFRYPGAQATAWMTFARAADEVVSWVLCAIFAFIVLFSVYFGIPWRHRVYGIGVGFFFYLSVDIAVTTVVAQYRLPAPSIVWPLDMLAFLGTCLIWIYYFVTGEVQRSAPTTERLKQLCAVLNGVAAAVDKCGQKVSREHSHNRAMEPRHDAR